MFKFIKKFIEIRKRRRINKQRALTTAPALLICDSVKDKKKFIQFTKLLVSVILFFAIVWITWNYVLATYALFTFQSAEPMVELSSQVCGVVIGTVIAYCLKAYLETLSEKTITPYVLNTTNANEADVLLPR